MPQVKHDMVSFILNTGTELIGKKWRAAVIWHLKNGPQRFSQIKHNIPGISVKMLSEVLKEMESHDLLIRKQYPGIPVKVTYEIHKNASEFINANLLYTLKVGEYIIKNSKKLEVPKDLLAQLTAWADNENKILLSSLPIPPSV